MNRVRFIQTTLRHPLRPEFSFAALSVTATFTEPSDNETLMKRLGIDPVSEGVISDHELRQMVICLLEGNLGIFELGLAEMTRYVNEIGIHMEYVDEVAQGKHIVIDRDRPSAFELLTVLRAAQDAALGLYHVPETGTAMGGDIPLIALRLVSSMVICGSAPGMTKALDHGLFDALHKSTAQGAAQVSPLQRV